MSKTKIIPSSERYKYLLSENDVHEPYRLTCPTLYAVPLTFYDRQDAFKNLEEIRKLGHQSILTYVNVRLCSIKIIGYTPPVQSKKRKAG